MGYKCNLSVFQILAKNTELLLKHTYFVGQTINVRNR